MIQMKRSGIHSKAWTAEELEFLISESFNYEWPLSSNYAKSEGVRTNTNVGNEEYKQFIFHVTFTMNRKHGTNRSFNAVDCKYRSLNGIHHNYELQLGAATDLMILTYINYVRKMGSNSSAYRWITAGNARDFRATA